MLWPTEPELVQWDELGFWDAAYCQWYAYDEADAPLKEEMDFLYTGKRIMEVRAIRKEIARIRELQYLKEYNATRRNKRARNTGRTANRSGN